MRLAKRQMGLGRKLTAWRDERGTAAVMFALIAPVLVGGAGFAVETSFDYVSQTHLQSAADAAAYAASLEHMGGSTSDVVAAAASQQATSNGWSSANGAITVNAPATTGPNAGQANAVEVQLTQTVPRFFTAYFSSSPVVLRARSVAISQTAANACILALNKTASQAAQFQGNTAVTLTGCDVMSNSIANDAINVWGSARMTADCAMAAGGIQNKAGMTLSGCPAAITQAPRVGDPFAGLPTPAAGTARSVPNGGHGTTTLLPGAYTSGMSLQGDVVLSPGVYYVSGGNFTVNANANVSGSGVTIYLASGAQVLMRGNATVNMAAPTSGTYSGILFFGARNGSGDNTFNGDASSHLTGDLYFPSESVSYLGNFAGANGCTQIVADTVQWSGSTTVAVDCAAQGMTAIPARQAIKIVE